MLIAPLDGNPLDGMICVGTNLYFQIIQPFSLMLPVFASFRSVPPTKKWVDR
jgi:hypothetical protein